ncbi:MAG: efflux RND transporter permease subunit [Desulfobacterales bacterium]|nr:efflux RND transporter permease subunit [Desulfobacterales bacterium]
MFLSNLSIDRPVLATVMMLSLITLGFFSYKDLPIDMYPNVEIPVVSIVTKYPGASPETVEREVSKKIEEAVNPISGIKHVSSTSRESVSIVVAQFQLEVKVDDVSQEVNSKINAIRGTLPREIEQPIIQKMDFNAAPIISLAVRSNNLNSRDLSDIADKKIKRRLETLPGVGQVNLIGLSKREVSIEIDPKRLESLGMGVDQLISGLQSENTNTPLGRLTRKGSEYPLRISGKPDAVSEFNNMIIGQSNQRPIKLSEIAKIIDGVEEKRSITLVNGVEAIGIDILKQSGANTIGVVKQVKSAIEKLKDEIPAGTSIEVVRDGSISIQDSVEDVKASLIEGGLLTIFIVFLFLNSWRSTVITGLTLPISVIASFIVMGAFNMTLNVMTLMALSLAIGLLIDDAIVVRENIVRHLETGKDHFTASRDGTSEIGLAVIATTFTIVAVFIPVAYMKGIVGRFFFQFGITIAFAVLVSLFVSFTWDPMLSSRWEDPDIERKGKRNFLARILDRFNDFFERISEKYRGVISWSLDHRKTVIIIATLTFILGCVIFAKLPSSFIPASDTAECSISFTTSTDASFEETKHRLDMVLSMLKNLPEIDHTYSNVGAGDTATVRDVSIYIKLKEKNKRTLTQKEIQRDIREKLKKIPGILGSVTSGEGKPLQVNIRGEEILELKKYASKMKLELSKVPGIIDLESTMEYDIPEYRLNVNRERAIDAGVMSSNIVRTVAAMVGGEVATTYEDEDGQAINVRVRLPQELRQDLEQVKNIMLSVSKPTYTGNVPTLIPLGELITYNMGNTPSEISRMDLSRQVVVSGNLDGVDLGSVMAKVAEIAANMKMPPGYKVVLSGEAEDMAESFGYLFQSLFLAIIFVYLILAAQFESFIDPFAIMFSLPLSIVGMALMLYITNDEISIMSLIGLIMLMGLVTKNAILLIDYTKVLIKTGKTRRQALIDAGKTRLRPIIMTTMAMIFGMMPLALAIGAGAEARAPMARAVIGGLLTSTLLTLLVVPVMYTYLDDFAEWLYRKWTGKVNIASLFLISIFLFSFNSKPVLAQGTILTIDSVLKLASMRNKDIKTALEFSNTVYGRYIEERSAALPQLTLTGTGSYIRDETREITIPSLGPSKTTIYDAKVTLTQPLFTWGKIGGAIRIAKIGMLTAEDQLKMMRQEVAKDVSIAFYDIVLALELTFIAKKNLQHKIRVLAESKRKYEAGTATEYDILSAEVAMRNAKPEVIQAENSVRIYSEQLGALIGFPEGDFEVDGSIDVNIHEIPKFNDVLNTSLNNRPDITELRHRMQIKKELVKIVGADNKPNINLQGSYDWQYLDVDSNKGDGKIGSIALIFTWQFFDGFKTHGRIIQAKTDVKNIEIEEEKLKDKIRLQVAQSLSNLRQAAETVAALTETVIQAEKLLEMANNAFLFGVKTILDVQDAQLNLKQAKANLAKAKRDYIAADITLKWVMGVIKLPDKI